MLLNWLKQIYKHLPIGSEIRISAFSGNSTSSTLPLITYNVDDIWSHMRTRIMRGNDKKVKK